MKSIEKEFRVDELHSMGLINLFGMGQYPTFDVSGYFRQTPDKSYIHDLSSEELFGNDHPDALLGKILVVTIRPRVLDWKDLSRRPVDDMMEYDDVFLSGEMERRLDYYTENGEHVSEAYLGSFKSSDRRLSREYNLVVAFTQQEYEMLKELPQAAVFRLDVVPKPSQRYAATA